MKILSGRIGPAVTILVATTVFVSCNSSKPVMSIPTEFEREATKMEINGLGKGGSQTSKPLSFAGYSTSRIKRGWLINSSRYDRDMKLTLEDRLLRAFNLRKSNITTAEKDKFHFTIHGHGKSAEVYGLERLVSAYEFIETNGQAPTNISRLKNSNYLFSAVILSGGIANPVEWVLQISGAKTPEQHPDRSFIDRQQWEETGFLANGVDTFQLKTVKVKDVQTKDGRKISMPFAVMKAYEFRVDGEVAAIVDSFGKVLWLYNQLDEDTGFVIAAASSALLVRRINIF